MDTQATPTRKVDEHPCLYGFAALVDFASPESVLDRRKQMARLEQLRVYFAFVEPLDIPEHDSDIRFGVAGGIFANGKLCIGGPEHILELWSGLLASQVLCKQCTHTPLTNDELATIAASKPAYAAKLGKFRGTVEDVGYCHGDGTKSIPLIRRGRNRRRCRRCHAEAIQKQTKTTHHRQAWADCLVGEAFRYSSDAMSDNSLHLQAESDRAALCDKLKHALLDSAHFDPVGWPTRIFCTLKYDVHVPKLSSEGFKPIFDQWLNGKFELSTSLSPVDGTVTSVKRDPVNRNLVVIIGSKRVLFPPQFDALVDEGVWVNIGTELAAPRQLTMEEFRTLPQQERVTLVNLLADGACIETDPHLKSDLGQVVYDRTYERKRGVIYYPYGLISSDQVGWFYVDRTDSLIGKVQVWNLPVQTKVTPSKYKLNIAALIEQSSTAAAHVNGG